MAEVPDVAERIGIEHHKVGTLSNCDSRLDLDLSVPGLVCSVFPGTAWLAELGRRGGRRTSAAKTLAARRNEHKGGRPRIR
jgi:hypothetical protein